MIEFDLVVRRYGRTLAVNGLTLTIPRGELFALLGPNGAGKTTAIRMLVGLLQPDSGHVRVCGVDCSRQAARGQQLSWAMCPTSNTSTRSFPAASSWNSPREMHGLDRATTRDRIARETQRFELADFLDNLTETYSHGMRQRLVFAIALLHDPQVLVVDEPMVGLDPRSARVVKDLLRAEAAAGKTVLMSTHTLAVAEEIADRIGILNRGQLGLSGHAGRIAAGTFRAAPGVGASVPRTDRRASGRRGTHVPMGRRRNFPHDDARPWLQPLLGLPSPEAESRGFLRLEWRILRTQLAQGFASSRLRYALVIVLSLLCGSACSTWCGRASIS